MSKRSTPSLPHRTNVTTRHAARKFRITQQQLDTLLESIVTRKFRPGFSTLNDIRPHLDELDFTDENTQRFLGRFALLVDGGYPGRDELDLLLKGFNVSESNILVHPFACVQFARAVNWFLQGDFSKARIALRRLVRSNYIESSDLRIIAKYMLARCLSNMARYKEAAIWANRALRLAVKEQRNEIAAMIRLKLAWLAFQEGREEDANALIDEAHSAMAREDADDHIGLGALHSLRGRIQRRQSLHMDALGNYRIAEDYYSRWPVQERALARTWINMAFDLRLLALQVERRIPPDASARLAAAQMVDQYRKEARTYLDKAAVVSAEQKDNRRLAMVDLYRGYLLLDEGELDEALKVSEEANRNCQTRDVLGLARVKLLQCAIMLKKADQPKDSEELSTIVHTALRFAEAAHDFAAKTSFDRLIGKTYLYKAICLATAGAADEARLISRIAEKHLALGSQDYLQSNMAHLTELLTVATPDVGICLKKLLNSPASTGKQAINALYWGAHDELNKLIVAAIWPRYRTIDGVTDYLGISRRIVKAAVHELNLNMPAPVMTTTGKRSK